MPVTLDYPLVRRVLLAQLFTDGNLELAGEAGGCNRVVLSDPRVAGREGELELKAQVSARLGIGSAGACSTLLDWTGGVGALGSPVIEAGARVLRLDVRETWLEGTASQQVGSGPLWAAANDRLKALLGEFTLDISPHLENIEQLLPEVLPQHSATELQSILQSLRLERVAANDAGLAVDVGFDVPEHPAAVPEPALSADELAQLEDRWQLMDAVLVYAVKRYAAATGLTELRGALFDVLLDSRYRLREVLDEDLGDTPDPGAPDRVRAWFIESWQYLTPVIREIGSRQADQGDLLWFTVISAADALAALDRLGPGVGLEISEDGLRRLARLVSQDDAAALLRYDSELDPELQQLFREQLNPAAGRPSAARPSTWRLDLSLIARAYASSPEDKLNSWVPERDELTDYLPTVAALLDASVDKTLQTYALESKYRELYRKLVLATAWQESCWRQYVVESDKRVPLRSGTGDVGLMQINERVWRGIYDLQRLRWDIAYNGEAGAEVLLDYLVKYALRKGEHQHSGGLNNLARASYSAYNGGPRQVSRYRRSDVKPHWKKVDAAFWEKYQQVDAGDALRVVECLGGDFSHFADSEPAPAKKQKPAPRAASATPTIPSEPPTTPPALPTTPSVPPASPSAPMAGPAWVASQPPEAYTVQVGAFSEANLATRFIVEERLAAPVYILPQRQDGVLRYLVLCGSFPTREAARSLQQRLGHLEPWLRRFGEVQTSGGF